MPLLKSINLALTFILELLMPVAFGYWGFQTGAETVVRFILGIGTPLLAAVVWGLFLAPCSTRRLTGLSLRGVELVIFGLAVPALAAAGRPDLAIIFAVAVVVNQALLVVWKQ